MWGCIMDGHKGALVGFKYPRGKGGGMNSEQYCEQVLKGCFYNYWMIIISI